MYYSNLNGKVINTQRFDSDTGEFIDAKPEFDAIHAFVQKKVEAQNCAEERQTGFLLGPSGVIYVAAAPVCKNNGAGKPVGRMAFAKYIDQGVISDLSKMIGQPLKFFDLPLASSDSLVRSLFNSLSGPEKSALDYSDPKKAFAMLKIDDGNQRAVGLSSIELSRDIHELGMITASAMLTLIAGVIAIMAVVILLILDRLVFQRLSRIHESVKAIGTAMLTDQQVPAEGSDEIGVLGRSINQMLAVIATQSNIAGERNDTLRGLLRVLSHDLANSLTIIDSSAKFGASDHPDDPNIKRVLRGAESLKKIIGSVRELDANQSGKAQYKLRPTPLHSVLDSLRFTFADKIKEKQLEFKATAEPNLSVEAEETVLTTTVLGNLLSNAIKFTPTGKSISVSAVRRLDLVVIEVTDDGIGIPAELRPKVFSSTAPTTRLGTQGERGTGFGMPLVRSAVERMGGQLDLESVTAEDSEGNRSGTTVRVTLKAA